MNKLIQMSAEDPSTFRFGKDEMCPTLEEVHRILEISRNVFFVPREGRPRESKRPVDRVGTPYRSCCVGIR